METHRRGQGERRLNNKGMEKCYWLFFTGMMIRSWLRLRHVTKQITETLFSQIVMRLKFHKTTCSRRLTFRLSNRI